MSIRDIIIEPISNTHFYGQYDKYKVVITHKYGNWYLSLDEITNSDEIFKDWKKFHKDLIKHVNDKVNEENKFNKKDKTAIFTITNSSNKKINGIYLHEYLFPHALGWVSVDYRLKMSKIILHSNI
jgi:hypothetical protein